MHIVSHLQVAPLASAHGETIYELIGRGASAPAQGHSLAYVTLPPGKASLPHWHPVAEESYYILQGRARMVIAGEEAELSPGDAVLIPPTQRHQIYSIGEVDLAFLAICAPAWEPANSVYAEDAPEG